MGGQLNSNVDQFLQQNRNRKMHAMMGNNTANYNLLHWNKSNSNFNNKTNDINEIIDLFRPHFFSLVESNYIFREPYIVKGYKMENSRLHISSSFARNTFLIRDNIDYERRNDLEDPYISSIWVEVNISSRNILRGVISKG